jgi:ATP-dependent DNA ligase
LAPLLAGVTDDFKVVGRAAAAQDAIRSPLVLSRVHWVEPKLVAEITYLTCTGDGLLRHTVFMGLLPDKPAEQVRREVPR